MHFHGKILFLYNSDNERLEGQDGTGFVRNYFRLKDWWSSYILIERENEQWVSLLWYQQHQDGSRIITRKRRISCIFFFNYRWLLETFLVSQATQLLKQWMNSSDEIIQTTILVSRYKTKPSPFLKNHLPCILSGLISVLPTQFSTNHKLWPLRNVWLQSKPYFFMVSLSTMQTGTLNLWSKRRGFKTGWITMSWSLKGILEKDQLDG